MKIVTASVAALWLCLAFVSPARCAEEFRGHWTLSKSHSRGIVQFGLSQRRAAGGVARLVAYWPADLFSVVDLDASGQHEVTFVIEREVGRIECQGFIEGGEGRGAFRLILSDEFLESQRTRHDDERNADEQFVMTLRALGLDFDVESRG